MQLLVGPVPAKLEWSKGIDGKPKWRYKTNDMKTGLTVQDEGKAACSLKQISRKHVMQAKLGSSLETFI